MSIELVTAWFVWRPGCSGLAASGLTGPLVMASSPRCGVGAEKVDDPTMHVFRHRSGAGRSALCPRCSRPLSAGSRRCPFCGSRLSSDWGIPRSRGAARAVSSSASHTGSRPRFGARSRPAFRSRPQQPRQAGDGSTSPPLATAAGKRVGGQGQGDERRRLLAELPTRPLRVQGRGPRPGPVLRSGPLMGSSPAAATGPSPGLPAGAATARGSLSGRGTGSLIGANMGVSRGMDTAPTAAGEEGVEGTTLERRAARVAARRAALAMVTTLPLRRLMTARRSGPMPAEQAGRGQTPPSLPGVTRRGTAGELLLWLGGTLGLLTLTALLAWAALLRSSAPLSLAWQGRTATVTATASGEASLRSAPGLHLVLLNAGPLAVGMRLRLAGSGFSAFAPVRFWLDGRLAFVDERGWPVLVEADGAGRFTVSLRLLPQWPPGRHTLLARDLQTGQAAMLALLLGPAAQPSATPLPAASSGCQLANGALSRDCPAQRLA
ncbi:hypothetical protein [Thermogemmatispora aurantia]|nr:hypothetical protein [Thermogemmatispora aurantia]